MQRYKLTLAYNGASFVGWQRQLDGLSVQGVLEQLLSTLLKQKVTVVGSGRTDAKVHALNQIAHFDAERCDCSTTLYRLNCLLPPTIRALALEEVDPMFHAVYSALKKEYHYHLWLDPVADPFLSPFRHQLRRPLDLEALLRCAELLIGRHDFTSFCNVNTDVKDKVRTLYRLDLVQQEGGYRLEYEADGFLYKMVRNLTSALIQVGLKKASLEEVKAILEAKDRRRAFPPAPGHALFLVKVTYPNTFSKLQMCEEGFLG